jgi:hypothetical protein
MFCGNCKYFVIGQGKVNSSGRCHRFPPQRDNDVINRLDEWPAVDFGDWCGEFSFKRKERTSKSRVL